VAVRTTLGSLLVGNLSSWVYSFVAGITAVAVTGFLYWLLSDKVSLVAISVVGAVVHNITQNTIFCLITDTPELYAYLPYLAVLGVVAGLIVGFAVVLLVKSVPFYKFLSDEN
jgi:heptaprenyl diphosphate synthase